MFISEKKKLLWIFSSLQIIMRLKKDRKLCNWGGRSAWNVLLLFSLLFFQRILINSKKNQKTLIMSHHMSTCSLSPLKSSNSRFWVHYWLTKKIYQADKSYRWRCKAEFAINSPFKDLTFFNLICWLWQYVWM